VKPKKKIKHFRKDEQLKIIGENIRKFRRAKGTQPNGISFTMQ
jgi:hypothetical protein